MNILDRFRSLYANLHATSPDDLGTIYTADVEFIDPIDAHHGLLAVKQYFSKLLEQAEHCSFDIDSTSAAQPDQPVDYTVTWTMTLLLKNKKEPIVLNGVTLLKVRNDLIFYHRDYYDMGEMVYEHIPVLRWVIGKIKDKLRQ